MKLDIDLIYSRLSRIYPVKMYSPSDEPLSISGPEPFIDNTMRLISGHTYVAKVEHLPHRPVIEENVLLVCIGESGRLGFYKERAHVIVVTGNVDFFQVYHHLLEIFKVYTDWESELLRLFMKSPSIQDIIDQSYRVFEAPIYVLDSAFRFTAFINPDTSVGERWKKSRDVLDPQSFLSFLQNSELQMGKKGAFLLNLDPVRILCVNLFNSVGEYIGCISIDYTNREYIKGTDRLAEMLAHMIERTNEINPLLMQTDRNTKKELMQMIVRSVPLGKRQKFTLESMEDGKKYCCISMHYTKHFELLPISYICSVLESVFTDSCFFENEKTILGVLPVKEEEGGRTFSEMLLDRLSALMEEMHLCVGVSNEFSNLYHLNIYYQQAEAAIEHGQVCAPEVKLHLFSDYALQELVENSIGDFPVESYFPRGLENLIEHDKSGNISYLNTLRVFLNENMSYARAARLLFVHRSTLIERIERIERELEVDLSDPEERLKLQLLLKFLEYEQKR